MVIGRGKHWTDERIGGRSAQRTIRNHANFETAGGIIAPTVRGVRHGPPALLPYFSHSQAQAPLNIFARDNTDPSNRALMGYSPSHRPDVWMTLKAVDANQTDPDVSADGSTTTFANLWDGATEVHDHGLNKSKSRIEVADNTCARVYRHTVKTAPGCSLQRLADGLIHLVDGDGVSHMHFGAVIAWDSTGSKEEPNLRASMDFGTPIGQMQVLETAAHADDFASAVGRMVYDPTLVISGAADLFDASTAPAGNADKNYGVHPDIFATTTFRGLAGVEDSALPIGTINLATMSLYSTALPLLATFHRMNPGNSWIEGTQSGSAEIGSPCHNWRAYNTVAWLNGSPGLVAGTDYATAGSPAVFSGVGLIYDVDITTDVAAWVGGAENAGLVMTASSASVTSFASQQTALYSPWIITIDYSTGYPAQLFQRRR